MMKLCSISNDYIKYLQTKCPNVYSNKEDLCVHSRKYIGVLLQIGEYNYFAPLSSPKNSDYLLVNGKRKVRKSIIPIIRIIDVDKNLHIQLKGTIRISHMIPVPSSVIVPYDVSQELDLQYKSLVQSELIYISRHENQIKSYARIMYNQKINQDTSANYVRTALNYKELERLCDSYSMAVNNLKI